MAKNNNNTMKAITIPIGLVGLLLGIIWYAVSAATNLKTNTGNDDRVHPIAEANRDKVIKIESDIEHMTKKLDEFIAEQRAVNTQVIEYLRTSNP